MPKKKKAKADGLRDALKITPESIHDWYKTVSQKIVLLTEIDNGVEPDLDAFAYDLADICLQAAAAVRKKERKAFFESQKRIEKKVIAGLPALIEFMEYGTRLQGLVAQARSEGIKIEPQEFMNALRMIHRTMTKLGTSSEKINTAVKAETWLVTEALPALYKKHFKKKWGLSRHPLDGTLYGPGMRFMNECLRHFEIDQSPEAIAKMISRHKGAKARLT